MSRHPEWERRLEAVIARHALLDGAWGISDCFMFAVDAFEAETARKLLPALRRYRSERAGYKLFRKHGFETVGEALASELETINRFRAGRGDLCTIERDGVEACGLVCADGVRVKALGRGFDLYSLTDIKRAFGVI